MLILKEKKSKNGVRVDRILYLQGGMLGFKLQPDCALEVAPRAENQPVIAK